MKDSVVISGIGVISPIGNNVSSYWNSLLYENNKPELFSTIPQELIGNCLYYRIKGWESYIDDFYEECIGRSSRLAIEATRMALEDSNLLDINNEEKVGVSVACGMGDMDLVEAECDNRIKLNGQSSFIFKNSAAIANYFGFSGPNLSITTACSAGVYSLSLGVELIMNGLADIVVVGGADSYSRVVHACFNRLGAIDSKICRPFDIDRNGTVFGDGVAILILESKEHALKRNYREWYAEVEGFGWSCDGYHPTAPDPSGKQAENAIRNALKDANLDPKEIDGLIPHGTGTILNDLSESKALERVFGEHINNILATAIKSKIGHSGSAAGAFSCMTGALMLKYGMCPPTENLTNKDPRCSINLITGEPIKKDFRHLLINAYAFGGNNASLILGRKITDE